jgi:hypothetical protein
MLGLEIMVVLVAAGLGLMVVVQHLLLVKEMLEVLAQRLVATMVAVVEVVLAQLEATAQGALVVLEA